MTNLFQETLNKLKNELDYQPILEEACKRVVLKYNPYPSQCNLEHFYDKLNKVDRINVKIGDVVHAIVICGNIVMNDDPKVIEHTKPYVIYLGDWDEFMG